MHNNEKQNINFKYLNNFKNDKYFKKIGDIEDLLLYFFDINNSNKEEEKKDFKKYLEEFKYKLYDKNSPILINLEEIFSLLISINFDKKDFDKYIEKFICDNNELNLIFNNITVGKYKIEIEVK